MSEFETVLQTLKGFLEALQPHLEVLKTLGELFHTLQLILAAILGALTKVLVAYIKHRQPGGMPPRTPWQKFWGSSLSIVFCSLAMAALMEVAARIGATPNDPRISSQLIRLGVMALTAIVFYNAVSIAITVFFTLFFGRGGGLLVVLIALMFVTLAVLHAPPDPGQHGHQGAWRQRPSPRDDLRPQWIPRQPDDIGALPPASRRPEVAPAPPARPMWRDIIAFNTATGEPIYGMTDKSIIGYTHSGLAIYEGQRVGRLYGRYKLNHRPVYDMR